MYAQVRVNLNISVWNQVQSLGVDSQFPNVWKLSCFWNQLPVQIFILSTFTALRRNNSPMLFFLSHTILEIFAIIYCQ